jgi:phage antirepressor YoqD-like protein
MFVKYLRRNNSMANYRNIIPFIKKWEGGLSRAKTDTASSSPAPFTTRARDYSQRGAPYVTSNDWHTNKGVTWTTFSGLASRLKYTPTKENWEQMPDSIWEKIFKNGYWDKVQGDKLLTQNIADLLADWYWGSGTWAVRNLQQVLNRSFGYKLREDGVMGATTLAAANKVDQKKLFDLLHAEKLDYYRQIGGANLKGWTNRANEFYNKYKNVIIATGGGIGVLVLVFAGVYLYNKYGTA